MRENPGLRERLRTAAQERVKGFELDVVKAEMKKIYEAAGAAE